MLWEVSDWCQERIGQLGVLAVIDSTPARCCNDRKSANTHLRLSHRFPSRPNGRAFLTLVLLVSLALVILLITACSGDDEGGGTPAPESASSSPSPLPTLLPPDAQAGTAIFQQFVDAVLSDDIDKAWSLYAASVEGTTEEHDAAFGCDFGAFSYEFPRLQHLFGRMAPFEVTETYATAPGSPKIEMRLIGADGTSFLGTVVRVHPLEQYRVQFLNNGNPSRVPGAPDPQPSPDDPMGICGIWTGGR